MITEVVLSKRAEKSLRRVPLYIVKALASWIESVEADGLEATRKISGYHDEPLKGLRAHQRSVRLNRSYRAIYEIRGEKVEFVEVKEVNKHEY